MREGGRGCEGGKEGGREMREGRREVKTRGGDDLKGLGVLSCV